MIQTSVEIVKYALKAHLGPLAAEERFPAPDLETVKRKTRQLHKQKVHWQGSVTRKLSFVVPSTR